MGKQALSYTFDDSIGDNLDGEGQHGHYPSGFKMHELVAQDIHVLRFIPEI